MSDFNYDIETTNQYYINKIKIYGIARQNGEPSLADPVAIEMLEPDADGNIVFTIDENEYAINMLGNILASLPDGTTDDISIDKDGNIILTKRCGFYKVTGNETFASKSYGSYIRLVLTNSISEHPSIAWQQGSGYCTHAPFIGSISGEFDHAYTTSTSPVYFAQASTGDEVLEAYTGSEMLYKLTTPYEINLGTVELPSKSQNLYYGKVESYLNPIMEIVQKNRPKYTVENPYQDYDAPEYTFPPNHPGQDWETFDANDWNESDMLDYTGQFESHAVYTVELCELMQSGTFDWSRPELDWSEAAYDTEQYERFCNYFEQRFMFREIGMLPPLQWFTALKRMLVFELMPKYKPLYKQVANGISPLGENEYLKRRHITSNYPETLLSGNSDYITTGDDEEYERIRIDNAAEALKEYREGFSSVDKAIGDELEVLFVSMYTSYVNGL